MTDSPWATLAPARVLLQVVALRVAAATAARALAHAAAGDAAAEEAPVRTAGAGVDVDAGVVLQCARACNNKSLPLVECMENIGWCLRTSSSLTALRAVDRATLVEGLDTPARRRKGPYTLARAPTQPSHTTSRW